MWQWILNKERGEPVDEGSVVGCSFLVHFLGVTSFAIEGGDHVMVVGKGIDSAILVISLRKKVKYADMINMKEVKPEDV
uniref:Uncharacterized protein n=1 Tax=Kalanchoe fedtschenkoi TaxID=63787 RepID=A0A7N0U553_KALFE